jgi:drug/metabolite transporter (DMT)-like permease
MGSSSNATLGNLLVFVNATSYSLYLILIKSLTRKYQPVTLAKWLYLLGLFMVIPFGIQEFNLIEWQGMPEGILWRIGFIVVFTSFLTYLLNLFAIRKLLPTTLSIFIYLQPVIATSYALLIGSDSLNLIKLLSTLLIFTGVFLVTHKPRSVE